MRLAWATDIHLDFVADEHAASFAKELRDAGDAAVITGDISNGLALFRHLRRFEASRTFFVLGNHDFYGGSVSSIRDSCRRLGGDVRWLPTQGVVPLSNGAALVGVDGWADARLGTPATTRMFLNDFFEIRELLDCVPLASRYHRREFVGSQREAMHAQMQAFADADAATANSLLLLALAEYDHVVFATHVPPFLEATWHLGQHSDDHALPYFSCHALGQVLRAHATANPTKRITVLCGHSHGAGTSWIAPNLEVVTGGAEYRRPVVQSRAIDV